jgi:hypothetical protein
MSLETIVIGVVFLMALGYLLNNIVAMFRNKHVSGCAKACNNCKVNSLAEMK